MNGDDVFIPSNIKLVVIIPVILILVGQSISGVSPGSDSSHAAIQQPHPELENSEFIQQQQTPETAVSIQPASATVTPGSTTTYDIVVENAAGGVGAYDFTIDVADSNVASITDVQLGGNPPEQTSSVTISKDESSADVLAALADTTDSGSVTIATVTVSGDDSGSSNLLLTINALGTEGGEPYTVTDTNGGSITVQSIDQPPTADAGSDQTVNEGASVSLDATGSSDPDGDSLSYTWTQTDGPSVALQNENSVTPSFTAPDVSGDQTLTFEVEVTDNDGTTAVDTVNVTVQDTDADGIDTPIGDFQNPPTDPDEDGKFEDVNGDGSVDVGDAQAIFANTDDPVVENNPAAFDFNDDGEVNVGDAQALFANGVEV